MSLTPEGARLLRQARDQILAHPEQFSMGNWGGGCGTAMCIAGWVRTVGHIKTPEQWSSWDISQALGFGYRCVPPDRTAGHPLTTLFYDHISDSGVEGAVRAAERINAFLWSYGYPPEAVTEPQDIAQPEAPVCG